MTIARIRISPLLILLVLLALAACAPLTPAPTAAPAQPTSAATTIPTSAAQPLTPTVPTLPPEVEIVPIPLSGPGSQATAQISGMAWTGDTLVLLPQYPRAISNQGGGALLALPKAEILAYLDDPTGPPLAPREIAFDSGGLEDSITDFEGFEAIAFAGSTAYLTIEASPGRGMKSYLVRGELSAGGARLALEADRLVEAPLPVQISNFSNEAILIAGERVILFFEANGAQAYPQASAPVFDRDLNPLEPLALASLEYRLTDATVPNEQGRFWVSNYFYPGDVKIAPRADPLAEQFGQGASHAAASVVERLVELQLPADGQGSITLTGAPPIQLKLAEGQVARNWEGLVRLDGRGFLLATDSFPETILAFVDGGR